MNPTVSNMDRLTASNYTHTIKFLELSRMALGRKNMESLWLIKSKKMLIVHTKCVDESSTVTKKKKKNTGEDRKAPPPKHTFLLAAMI